MSFEGLPGNLARVQDTIADVQRREGVSGPVRIVAVTKGHGPEAVRAASRAGLTDVAENRVPEAVQKRVGLEGLPVTWHLIGHLQTNKAKHVPACFAVVHSVDSERVAAALERAAATSSATVDVLVQVNVAGEAQKSGCSPGEAEAIIAAVADSPHLELRGLMTMAPFVDDTTIQRRVFGALRRLREQLQSTDHDLPELSMGMSGDYESAVAEGATMLRLGTVLFGERPT
jgi:pyridoxal phosphate enzyme (YggS family)